MADFKHTIIIGAKDETGPAYASAKQANASFAESTAMGAKQAAAAMRMIPAQMTDIVVSLQSGQAPLTVLLQQGGQLKDMFGGVAPAAKAVGNYLLAMVSPLTVSAAGVAALALAYHQGSDETREYNKQLALTGNVAGLSASQLAMMAAVLGKNNGTQSQAADVLAQLVGTGKIASSQFDVVATAAIRMSKTGVASIKEIVAEFVQLGEEPAKASAKLNEQHHYLTQSIYEQIKALEDQGKKAEAAALAQKTYATAMAGVADQVKGNLGTLQRAWAAITGAAKGAWDAMLNIGRQETTQDRLSGLSEKIVLAQKAIDANGFATTGGGAAVGDPRGSKRRKDELEGLRAQQAALQETLRMETRAATATGERVRAEQAAIAADDILNKWQDKAKGMSAVNRELKNYRDGLEAVRKVNPGSDRLTPENIAAGEKAIRAAHEGPKGSLPKEDGIDARLARLKAANEEEQRLLKQNLDTLKSDYDIGALTQRAYLDKIFEARQNALQRELDIARQMEEVARGKRNVSAVEKYSADVKRVLDEIAANWDKQGKNVDAYNAKLQRAVAEYRASLNAKIDTRQQGIDDELMGAGLGAKALESLRRQTEVRREYDKLREQLRRDKDKGEGNGGLTAEQYAQQLAELDAYYQSRLGQEQDFNVKSAALGGEWRVGSAKALAEYNEAALDVAGQSQRAFSGLYSGLEDAAVAWATGSKASFKDVARSFAAELVRMEVRAQASSVYKAIAGGSGGSGWASLLGTAVGLFGGTAQASFSQTSLGSSGFGTGAAYGNQDMGQFFAKGGTPKAAGLHDYVNTIVSRPTIFPFAKGIGMMGEDGDEAIMPLRRGRDGRLGVSAAAPSAGNSGPAKISLIHQTQQPMQMVQQRTMSDGEIVLMIREQAAQARSGAVDEVAASWGDPSHPVSQSFEGNYRAPRSRA